MGIETGVLESKSTFQSTVADRPALYKVQNSEMVFIPLVESDGLPQLVGIETGTDTAKNGKTYNHMKNIQVASGKQFTLGRLPGVNALSIQNDPTISRQGQLRFNWNPNGSAFNINQRNQISPEERLQLDGSPIEKNVPGIKSPLSSEGWRYVQVSSESPAQLTLGSKTVSVSTSLSGQPFIEIDGKQIAVNNLQHVVVGRSNAPEPILNLPDTRFISVADLGVSGIHLELCFINDTTVLIHNLQPTNGTMVFQEEKKPIHDEVTKIRTSPVPEQTAHKLPIASTYEQIIEKPTTTAIIAGQKRELKALSPTHTADFELGFKKGGQNEKNETHRLHAIPIDRGSSLVIRHGNNAGSDAVDTTSIIAIVKSPDVIDLQRTVMMMKLSDNKPNWSPVPVITAEKGEQITDITLPPHTTMLLGAGTPVFHTHLKNSATANGEWIIRVIDGNDRHYYHIRVQHMGKSDPQGNSKYVTNSDILSEWTEIADPGKLMQ